VPRPMRRRRAAVLGSSEPAAKQAPHVAATSCSGWPAAACVASLLAMRLASAALNTVHDCDEVFNYWEPLHNLLHGSGLQTWENRCVRALQGRAARSELRRRAQPAVRAALVPLPRAARSVCGAGVACVRRCWRQAPHAPRVTRCPRCGLRRCRGGAVPCCRRRRRTQAGAAAVGDAARQQRHVHKQHDASTQHVHHGRVHGRSCAKPESTAKGALALSMGASTRV